MINLMVRPPWNCLLEVCWATNLPPGTGSLTERDSRPEQTGRKFIFRRNS